MGRIIPVKMNMEPILKNRELQYAVKHQGEGLRFEGIWQADQFRDGVLISGGYPESKNIFTTEGLAYLLNIIFFTTQKAAALIWYCGLFKANVSPGAADTAAKLGVGNAYDELQATTHYDEAARQSYTTATTATATITNAVAGKAEFTIADTLTVHGAHLTNTSATTDVSGKLMCAKKFTASRAVIDGDVLSISYGITCTSS